MLILLLGMGRMMRYKLPLMDRQHNSETGQIDSEGLPERFAAMGEHDQVGS